MKTAFESGTSVDVFRDSYDQRTRAVQMFNLIVQIIAGLVPVGEKDTPAASIGSKASWDPSAFLHFQPQRLEAGKDRETPAAPIHMPDPSRCVRCKVVAPKFHDTVALKAVLLLDEGLPRTRCEIV